MLFSGGMDSTTLLYHLLDSAYIVHAISFNYGQRHRKEINTASLFCNRLGVKHTIINLSFMQPLLIGSALTDTNIAIPHGYYTEETMRLTVVPNRNMMMLSIAGSIAVSENVDLLALAVHAGDHYIYPDCRPEFISALNAAFIVGNAGHAKQPFHIYAPYLYLTKTEIAQEGTRLGVPFEDTWTCYEGGEIHCGVCGSCQERRLGFIAANVPDKTLYGDTTIYSKLG